jgi:hypothetical protein
MQAFSAIHPRRPARRRRYGDRRVSHGGACRLHRVRGPRGAQALIGTSRRRAPAWNFGSRHDLAALAPPPSSFAERLRMDAAGLARRRRGRACARRRDFRRGMTGPSCGAVLSPSRRLGVSAAWRASRRPTQLAEKACPNVARGPVRRRA